MQRRPSIPNRPGTRFLPSSYQQEPIPMINLPRQTSIMYNNSLKHNRVAPPPPSRMDHSIYSQPLQSFDRPTSIISSNNPLIQSYYRRQSSRNLNYSNQSYYPQNNNSYLNGDLGENNKSNSWSSKPLCLGLTRLSGGILFGTMIILSIASIAGLITSVVLYIQDPTTNPQWKVLGMVLCSIMLLTVLITLCIFIYCYKKGHIISNKPRKMNSLTSPYNQENDYRYPYNYNQSIMPYGMMKSISPTSNHGDIVHVQDKLTNTEITMCPIRPRDFQYCVWQGINAYNGLSYRPIEPRKMVNRIVQVLINEIEPIPSKQKSQIIELPKKIKTNPRFENVSVKHVKPIDEPENLQDDFNTDHFYQ